MKTKIHYKITRLILLAVLTSAGCGLLGGGATATVQSYFNYTQENKPEEMVKLYSKAYLEKNKNALEECRDFVKFMREPIAQGKKIVLLDVAETKAGETAVVKGNYSVTDNEMKRPFEARLVKENGEWKLDTLERK